MREGKRERGREREGERERKRELETSKRERGKRERAFSLVDLLSVAYLYSVSIQYCAIVNPVKKEHSGIVNILW